jgi:hypothetical protein
MALQVNHGPNFCACVGKETGEECEQFFSNISPLTTTRNMARHGLFSLDFHKQCLHANRPPDGVKINPNP